MNMVPDSAVFIEIGGDDKILSNGHPASQWRTELRHIPNLRNAISIASIYVQTVGIIWTALALRNPITYVIAFLLMGRAHAQLLALMHESVHRLLFRKRKLNDFAGRWLLGYMSFVNTDGYRYVHMAHHREEFGPNEPDIPLYANYPITRACGLVAQVIFQRNRPAAAFPFSLSAVGFLPFSLPPLLANSPIQL